MNFHVELGHDYIGHTFSIKGSKKFLECLIDALNEVDPNKVDIQLTDAINRELKDILKAMKSLD